jgi:hypothetical protein
MNDFGEPPECPDTATNRDCDRWVEMKSQTTHPEVCDTDTEIASYRGSIANSPNVPTFHDPPAHSNHPAESFLKGMHNLARGCPAQRRLPRVRCQSVLDSLADVSPGHRSPPSNVSAWLDRTARC